MSSHFFLARGERELIIDRIRGGRRVKWYQLFLVRKCPFHLLALMFFRKKGWVTFSLFRPPLFFFRIEIGVLPIDSNWQGFSLLLVGWEIGGEEPFFSSLLTDSIFIIGTRTILKLKGRMGVFSSADKENGLNIFYFIFSNRQFFRLSHETISPKRDWCQVDLWWTWYFFLRWLKTSEIDELGKSVEFFMFGSGTRISWSICIPPTWFKVEWIWPVSSWVEKINVYACSITVSDDEADS